MSKAKNLFVFFVVFELTSCINHMNTTNKPNLYLVGGFTIFTWGNYHKILLCLLVAKLTADFLPLIRCKFGRMNLSRLIIYINDSLHNLIQKCIDTRISFTARIVHVVCVTSLYWSFDQVFHLQWSGMISQSRGRKFFSY